MHLGLIGYGNIARALLRVLAREGAAPARLSVLVRAPRTAETRAALAADFAGASHVVTDAAALVAQGPDLVVECAGHSAVQDHATLVLAAGIDTVITSIGALADAALLHALEGAAQGGARAVLPAGAIGGIDLLSALRPSGIASVVYTGRKPPMAWAGTPAEGLLDLTTLREPATFFTGTAGDAARDYPKNANVAATLALAGVGFAATQVRLVADPTITRNIHDVSVSAGAADFSITIAGTPSPDNPKTSLATVYSVAREVMNRQRKVAI
jgi:aspartate dehydrogenase